MSLIDNVLDMNYYKFVDWLQNKKYKPVPYAYFDEKGYVNKNNKITGLAIHHVIEYEQKFYQTMYRFGANEYTRNVYHQPKWLCYCNYLEHLILHIKIYIEKGIGKTAIVKYMIPRFVDYLSGAPQNYFANWDYEQMLCIEDNYDFFIILKWMFENTDITPKDFEMSYLEKYGTEKFYSGKKVHIKNDWTFEKNIKVFEQIKQIYNTINNR